MTCASEKDYPQCRIPERSLNLLFVSLVVILLLLGSVVTEKDIAYILRSQASLAGRKQMRAAPVDGMCTPRSPADLFCVVFFLICFCSYSQYLRPL